MGGLPSLCFSCCCHFPSFSSLSLPDSWTYSNFFRPDLTMPEVAEVTTEDLEVTLEVTEGAVTGALGAAVTMGLSG